MKICHLTTVHPRYDTRIFMRECKTLAEAGYHTSLIVADGKGNEEIEGINIIDIGINNSRLKRMLFSRKRILSAAIELDADIYHLHDPELLLIVSSLLRKGKKVIYDAHEDLPRQIVSKDYIHGFMKPIISFVSELIENSLSKRVSAVITVTPTIKKRFQQINKNTVMLRNFPDVSSFSGITHLGSDKTTICYIGSISEERGIIQILDAIEDLDINFLLAGDFISSSVQKKAEEHSAWSKTHYFGYISQQEVFKVLSLTDIALVIMLPYDNNIFGYPRKLFEYMAAGIPIIASNFPIWEEMIGSSGICVDPTDSKAIADAIQYIVNNPEIKNNMSESGKKSAHEKYNWEKEKEILYKLYHSLSDKTNRKENQ